MKRILLIVLCLLVLLLSACELRNRQDSADFFPEQEDSVFPTGLGPYGEASESRPAEKQTVKTVMSYTAELPWTRPELRCSYELPMIDLNGAQAMGCNQEIEAYFGSQIQDAIDDLERYETPALLELNYTYYTISGILTLRIDRRDSDGNVQRAYYTVDASTGDAVGVERLFDAAGVSGTAQEVVGEALFAAYTRRFGPVDGTDTAKTTALNRTQEGLLSLSPKQMHLTEDSRLAVAMVFFAPDGSSSMDELLLP